MGLAPGGILNGISIEIPERESDKKLLAESKKKNPRGIAKVTPDNSHRK